MAGPVGVKLGAVDRLDIPDIFAVPQEKVDRFLYHDPSRAKVEPGANVVVFGVAASALTSSSTAR